MKKFILCADGFGKNKDYNRAVLNGYNNGFVRSTSIIANGEAYDAAINDILPECQKISIGVHINLTEGKSLTATENLTDKNNNFCLSYKQLSKAAKDINTLTEIEYECRAQIEKIKKSANIYHINSYQNIHLIPEIFELVCKLANEYNIKYVRTHNEELYYVPDLKHIFDYKYYINIGTLLKYNHQSAINRKCLKLHNLKSSNYTIGTCYKNNMDSKAVEYGLKTLNDEDNILVECIINPCSYLRNINDGHSTEFKMTQDKILEDTICRMGYDITNHKAYVNER